MIISFSQYFCESLIRLLGKSDQMSSPQTQKPLIQIGLPVYLLSQFAGMEPPKKQNPSSLFRENKGSFTSVTILIYLPSAFKPLGCRGYDDTNGLNGYYIIWAISQFLFKSQENTRRSVEPVYASRSKA